MLGEYQQNRMRKRLQIHVMHAHIRYQRHKLYVMGKLTKKWFSVHVNTG